MATKRSNENKDREKRIMTEIIVDSNGPEEQSMGWYYYLDENLKFPFTAVCIEKRVISPLKVKEEVVVLEMAPGDECEKEMFVMIRWQRDSLAVPLSQLAPINSTDEQTKEAVEDWHYWVQMGYEFG